MCRKRHTVLLGALALALATIALALAGCRPDCEITRSCGQQILPPDAGGGGMGGFDPGFTGKAVSGFGFGDHVAGMALANDDSVIIAGTFVDGFAFRGINLAGGGLDDIFVIKLDASGTPLWARPFNAIGDQTAVDVAASADGSFVMVGSFSQTLPMEGAPFLSNGHDAFVAKFSPTGRIIWVRTFGGTSDQRLVTVAVSSEGAIAAAGTFQTELDDGTQVTLTNGGTDAFLLVLSSDGELITTRTFGGMGDDRIVATAWLQQNVVFAGDFEGTFNLGSDTLTSAGETDAFVAQLQLSNGTVSWSRVFSDAAAQRATALAVHNDKLAFAGAFTGLVDVGGGVVEATDTDGVVVMLDSVGAYLAHVTIDGADEQQVSTVSWLDDGGLALGGHFQKVLRVNGAALAATPDGGDSFVLRMSNIATKSVSVNWVQHFANNHPRAVHSIRESKNGQLIVTGDFTGDLQLDAVQLASRGTSDAYLLRFDP